MALDLTSLRKAVHALGQVLERCEDEALVSTLDPVTRHALRSGAIQHFEFTFELCWKFLQRWIRLNRTPEEANFPRTRKDLFRLAARYGLVEDPTAWFVYAEARNLTSHTYNEEEAARVYEVTQRFFGDAKALLSRLEAAND